MRRPDHVAVRVTRNTTMRSVRTLLVGHRNDVKEGDYTVDGGACTKDALGFIKDWVTSVLQLETTIVSAIGAAFFLKTSTLAITGVQKWVLFAAAFAFGLSIMIGVLLLNMLPGAVQRKPSVDKTREDIFSIYTANSWTIENHTVMFRNTFFLGVGLIILFILVGVVSSP